jgi:alpha-L-arabinofuranosidase
LLVVVPSSQTRQAVQATGSITIDASTRGHAVPPRLYGIFYEEISHAGDGGLYAELIQNRGFEDANLPPTCTLDNGFIIPPRTPHFDSGQANNWRLRWNVDNPHPAWSLDATGGAEASIDLVLNEPLNDATPHSLKVTVSKAAGAGGRVALLNEGYWGIGVAQGAEYKLSFFARSDAARGRMTASLERRDGTVLASAAPAPVAESSIGPWRKYSATLRATAADPKARLALTFASPGAVWLDVVSLFPAKTFRNRPNGLKPELAQIVADLKPGFIRGPGGCFAEGITVESRPQWKRSIGPIEQRPGTYSPWEYWSTDGLGYHEFLQFAEDIGADALWVVNAGVSCSFRSGTFLPDDQVPALIQDTLEAIEYAIGPTSTKWGGERAKNGHPAPFPLKYIEIGNEQQGARYGERWSKFNAAIKMKYPEIKVVLSSWISGIDRRSIGAAGKIDIVDEHAYKPLNWAIENFDSFAKYARGDWDLYIGEFATNSGVGRGNLIAALNDAAYMMSVEKNSDLVKMASYAPLLENVDQPRRNWEVNMIHFDSSRIFARASYYVQKMFAENMPGHNLSAAVEYQPATTRPIAGRVGVGTWNTAAEFKDIRVEQGGRVVYQSDFSSGTSGFAAPTGRGQGTAGTWAAVEGALRQSSNSVAFSWVGETTWQDVTISLKARKISGAEGFLVLAGTADGRRVQWNVGGWTNRQTALQAGDAIVGQAVPATIETGRWYDARVEVRGRNVKAYLDGALVSEATFPRVDTVLAIAGRDERTGDVIIKAVNTSSDPASMAIRLTGVTTRAMAGRVTTLSSAAATDENSFDQPTKIVPVTKALTTAGPNFTQVLPPLSVTILRLK